MLSLTTRLTSMHVLAASLIALAAPACMEATRSAEAPATCPSAAPSPLSASASASASAAPAATAYTGGECDPHRLSAETSPKRKDIFDHLCATDPAATKTAADAKSNDDTLAAMTTRRRAFDDRRVDPIAVALQVMDGAHLVDSWIAIGTDAIFVSMFDENALRSHVAKLDLSEAAKSAFVAAALSAKGKLTDTLAALDARRKRIYVDVQADVAAARQAYFHAHADAYAKLDVAEEKARAAKLAKRAPRELITELESVRRDSFATCASDACRFDPLAIEVTRRLVSLYAAAGDTKMANAENALLQEPAAGRHLFAVETGRVLYASMVEEYRSWCAYSLSKQDGEADAVLTTRFGPIAPHLVDPDPSMIAADVLPDLAPLIDGNADHGTIVVGVVRTVTDARGGSASSPKLSTISFRDDILPDSIATCFETGRVTDVHFDDQNHATLQPEIACETFATKSHFEKRLAPITVPKAEAIHIAPGELLTALVSPDKRTGIVVRTSAVAPSGSAKTPTPVLQIRGERIGVKVSK